MRAGSVSRSGEDNDGEYILLRHRQIPGINKLEVYRKNRGFEALKKVVTTMQPDEVTNVVKASGLRGRGGAGFPPA